MWPIADAGPYYAALVTGGTLDTKGGPKADARRPGRSTTSTGRSPASTASATASPRASARAYWAGGATLGPIIAFAYRAARASDREAARAPADAARLSGVS